MAKDRPKQPGGKKTSGSKKRVRSSNSTPPVAKSKRLRRQETTSKEHSYREVVASHFCVVIDVHHPLGKLTADQMEMIQNDLMGALDRQLNSAWHREDKQPFSAASSRQEKF